MSNEHEHCVAQEYEDSPPRVLDKLRFHLFVCTDSKECGCDANGSGALLAALRGELAKRRLMAQVKITIMQCRQPGIAGPVLVVHPDGIWYDGLVAADAAEFVETQIVGGKPLARRLFKDRPKPVSAVPAHIADAECCATPAPVGTPEERVAAQGR